MFYKPDETLSSLFQTLQLSKEGCCGQNFRLANVNTASGSSTGNKCVVLSRSETASVLENRHQEFPIGPSVLESEALVQKTDEFTPLLNTPQPLAHTHPSPTRSDRNPLPPRPPPALDSSTHHIGALLANAHPTPTQQQLLRNRTPQVDKGQNCITQMAELPLPHSDNQHSSDKSNASDDFLCETFNVSKACVSTKRMADHLNDSSVREEEPEIGHTMKLKEEKTLTFLNEEGQPHTASTGNATAPKKSRLRFKSSNFFVNSKFSEGLIPLGGPEMAGDAKTSKETSMYSTVDSKQNVQLRSERIDKMSSSKAEGDERDLVVSNSDNSGSYVMEYQGMLECYGQNNHRESANGEDQSGLLKIKFRGTRHPGVKIGRKCHPIDNVNDFRINIDELSPHKTTLMIKNIPNRYTKEMMLAMVDQDFRNAYDFFYLPIDQESEANVGYAFINFIDPSTIRQFYKRFAGTKWQTYNSDKVCDIFYARIQGKSSCMEHFRNSNIMRQDVR
jgi:hypothetical protein